MSQILSIKNLSKVYANGTQALRGIDLTVPTGEFFALLGANGAGKTTLIGILTGLVNKTAGQVKMFGFDIETQLREAKRLIGVVPQEFNFNIFEKVQDIVVTQAGYFGIPRAAAFSTTQRLLKRLGLWEKRQVAAGTLSGGMKRRLLIARALVHHPKLLILDEPTAGVDVELRYGMWEYLKEMNQRGMTVILTTHYLEEVERLCRSAAIIKNGVIVKEGRVADLIRLLEREVYVFSVQKMLSLERLKDFAPVLKDDQTLEVELDKASGLNAFLKALDEAGFLVTHVRPKGHSLETLFLNMVKP